jgi:ABC-type Mn2+/Zn2+ transport system ATPase subunit
MGMDDDPQELTELALVDTLSNLLLNGDDSDVVDGLDQDLVSYIAGMLSGYVAEQGGAAVRTEAQLEEAVTEVFIPFLESVNCPEGLIERARADVFQVLRSHYAALPSSAFTATTNGSTTRKLTQGIVSLSSDLQAQSQNDAEANAFMWAGAASSAEGRTVKAMANDLIDAHHDKSSAKEKRKLRKVDAEKARKLLSSKSDRDTDQLEGAGLVSMKFRSASANATAGADRRMDIQVRNVTVGLNNGTTLLDNGELKFSYQRRYGLIGENGVGKSTLLKHIAAGSDIINGFPDHLRVLHVRQEVPAHLPDGLTVLNAVLLSDVERNSLLEQEKSLVAKLEGYSGTDDAGPASTLSFQEKRKKIVAKQSESSDTDGSISTMKDDLKKLDDVYARLELLGADSAEARAAMILSGLQFTPDMQHGPVSALSGGWKMRVALAAALFIEPDLCMLDEPVRFLEVSAVPWYN